LRIGVAYSLAPVDRGGDGPDDRFEEFDKPETIEAIADVFRGEGHEVVLLGDGAEFLVRVIDDRPDFVFNIAEGEGVGRCRESRVPAVLEMLGIPYSGSDPLTLAASLDKDVAKRLVKPRVAVAAGVAISPDVEPLEALPRLAELAGFVGFPLILKPAFEGSSKGIRGRCLAGDIVEATTIYRELRRAYRQPILAEEFVVGDEVTVGLIGNGPAVEVLGAMRVRPKQPTENFVYSLEVKRDWARRVDYEAPARLSPSALESLTKAAVDAYQALGCRDVARIDFRVRSGVPTFLEANPLPGLSPESSDLVILARGHGISYEDLIRRILNAALARVGLARPVPVAP
jgi:D-alanine-D-alanine ligase